MLDHQVIEIGPGSLVSEALKIKHDGYRLVQICATRISEGYELTYSFAKEYEMIGLRLKIKENTEIISISNIFEPAFLYENEIHDLFGVNIALITLDYKGNFYRVEQKTPYK